MAVNILHTPDKIQIITEENRVFSTEQNEISVSVEGNIITASSKQNAPVSYIKLRWYGSFADGSSVFCDCFERGYGEMGFYGITPEKLLPWYTAVAEGDNLTGYGVGVRSNAICMWQIDHHGVTLWCDVRNGTHDYILNGTLLLCETVMLCDTKDKFGFLRKMCEAMASDKLEIPHKIYGFNNWYYAYGQSSAEQIAKDTDLLISLTAGLENRPYMVIDDGWQVGNPGAPGTLGCHVNEKFGDMKAVADNIASKGAVPGLWLRPQAMTDFDIHPDLAAEWDEHTLDLSLDESLALIAADIERVTGEWGYRLIKFDFATYDITGNFAFDFTPTLLKGDRKHRRNFTNAQIIKRLYKTIFDHSNGAVIIGCNCVGHLGCGYFHIHRSGDDTSGFYWERTRKMGINTLAYRLPQHGVFFEMDADCVGILKKNIDWKLNSQWLDLLAHSGTPLFVSAEPESTTDEMKNDLKNAFLLASVQKNTLKPVDLTTSSPCKWLIDGEMKEYNFDDTMGVDMYGV